MPKGEPLSSTPGGKDREGENKQAKGLEVPSRRVVRFNDTPDYITQSSREDSLEDFRDEILLYRSLRKFHEGKTIQQIITEEKRCQTSSKFRQELAAELKNSGVSAKELKDSGFSEEELKDLTDDQGNNHDDLQDLDTHSPMNLEETKQAVESKKKDMNARLVKIGATLRKMLSENNISADELTAAGISAAELKDVGFSAKDLKDPKDLKDDQGNNIGFSAVELRDGGFSVEDLMDAGFSVGEIKKSGFTPHDLYSAGLSASNLLDNGWSALQLKEAGFDPIELSDAGLDTDTIVSLGFSPKALGEAGLDDTAKQFQRVINSLREVEKKVSVDSYMYYQAKRLQKATFNGESIGAYAFAECPKLQYFSGSVKKIGMSAFAKCTRLKSVDIKAEDLEISSSAFNGCSSLQSVVITGDVESIAPETFANCRSLKTIRITGNVKDFQVNWCSFIDCPNLESIDIRDVENINVFENDETPMKVFADCPKLKKITGLENLLSEKTEEERVCFIEDLGISNPELIASLMLNAPFDTKYQNGIILLIPKERTKDIKKIIIPPVFGLETWRIGNDACKGFYNVEQINIPNTVTEIGDRAFENCNSLQSIIIPKNVKKIGQDAFKGCEKLDSESLQSIYDYLNRKCTKGFFVSKATRINKEIEKLGIPWNHRRQLFEKNGGYKNEVWENLKQKFIKGVSVEQIMHESEKLGMPRSLRDELLSGFNNKVEEKYKAPDQISEFLLMTKTRIAEEEEKRSEDRKANTFITGLSYALGITFLTAAGAALISPLRGPVIAMLAGVSSMSGLAGMGFLSFATTKYVVDREIQKNLDNNNLDLFRKDTETAFKNYTKFKENLEIIKKSGKKGLSDKMQARLDRIDQLLMLAKHHPMQSDVNAVIRAVDEAYIESEGIVCPHKIAEIHKILNEHKGSADADGSENSEHNSQTVIDQFTELHNTLNTLEDPSAGQTVDQDMLAAMHKTIDNIYKKVAQSTSDTSNMKEAHEAIDRAHKIAEIHKILNDHKGSVDIGQQQNTEDESQSVIDKFTELHKKLNTLEDTPAGQTVDQGILSAMTEKLDNIHTKAKAIEQQSGNVNVNEVHQAIDEADNDIFKSSGSASL